MALGGPNIYPSVLTWLGVGRELTAGTPVMPVITHPLDQGSFEPEDTPKFLQDKAIRGSMTDLFYETLGVESAAFSFGGPNFLDSHGYFFDNVFGDLSTTAAVLATATTATMTTAGTPVGALTIPTGSAPTGFSTGSIVQIGTALTSNTPASYLNEVATVLSTGATSIVINQPLRFAHGTAATINGSTVAGNTVITLVATGNTVYTHRFAALNSNLGYGGAYGAQPPTHTFSDVTNIVNTGAGLSPNTYGTRQYASACLKNIDFSGNAEQLLGIKMAGDSWLSVPATSAPTNLTTGVRPIPNWVSNVTIGGTAITTIGEFAVSFKRQTQVYWTVQGIQSPFVIARGPLTMDGTINYDPTNSELPLDLMLQNQQGAMAISLSNSGIPNSGQPFTLTFNANQVANIKSKINRSKDLLSYGNSFEAVGNPVDTGGSGGLGPGTITLVNNVATY